ncbi:hypothetical protein LTR50_000355 [Elasticomyces elasticus]|nr:hypothetical protein LTR50_000355 [Elasticomyces elasticus]
MGLTVSQITPSSYRNDKLTGQFAKDPSSLSTPKIEKPGEITSDSLAAESLASGGSFGANTGAAASSQPSSSTTANNTDISSATILQPAPDAEARDAQSGWSETAQLNAGRNLAKDTSQGPTYTTPGDDKAAALRSGESERGGRAYNTVTGSGANVGTAPSYVSASGPGAGGEGRPHGKNITEGGFDSDGPNASFNQDIGGKNDPGRAALGQFQKQQAESGGGAGGGPRQTEITGDGQFDALGETSA